MANFQDLRKPKINFVWTPELKKEFQDAKKEIIKLVENGMKLYDISRRTCCSTDWSKIGIGFLITQKWCQCPDKTVDKKNDQDAARLDGGSSLQALRSAPALSQGMLR